MAENGANAEEGAKLTTEQLLTELGKLVFSINKQLGTITQKLESLDRTLAEGVLGKLESIDRSIATGLMEKLDGLAGLQTAGNAVLDSIPGAIEETGRKIDSLDKKADNVDKSVKALTDKSVKELKNVASAGKDLGKELSKAISELEGKMSTGFADAGSGINQGLKPVEEALSALMTKTDSMLEGVKHQTDETVRLSGIPSPVHPDLVTKLDELAEEVRKSSSNLDERYASETTRLIESPPHPDLVSKLDGIIEQARLSSESLDGNLTRTAEGIVAAIGSSDDSRKALLEEKFVNLSDRMSIFPESVSQLGEKLTGKIEDFRSDAGKLLEEASTSLERSSSTLETVEKIVEETRQEQSTTLGRMMELVERHRENADEAEIERLNSLAIQHFNNAEYTLAQDSVEKALMLGANRAELWSNLAHVKAAAGDMTGSEEAFRKALQLEPELDQAVSGLGVLMVDTGRPQETIEFLREFLMDESPSIRTTMAYAKALAATGRHAEALDLLRKAKELAPDNPEIDAEIAAYSESGSVPPPAAGVQSNIQGVLQESAEEEPRVAEGVFEGEPLPVPDDDDLKSPFGGGKAEPPEEEEEPLSDIITENVLLPDPEEERIADLENEAEHGS
jgi:tetratricopeptide (TPR) repeat protein/uncharacterized protein YukE